METLLKRLRHDACSLVVRDATGNITTYYKKGVRDLEDLLDHHPERLREADIADKVIGKAAAGMAVYGGVRRIAAEVMSSKALPLLHKAGVSYQYGRLVDHIIIPDGDNRCPLEQIVAQCDTPADVVKTLRHYFHFMQQQKQSHNS